MKKPDSDPPFLIPASKFLEIFNREFQTDCQTLAETVAYLDQHPEARRQIEEKYGAHRKRTPKKK